MKALVFVAPGQMEVQDRPIPTPARDEALVRVEATGICGSDIHGYMGKTGRRTPGMVMGHEVVGRVQHLEIGSGRSRTDLHDALVAVNPVISCGTCPYCVAGQDNRCNAIRLIGVDHDIVGGFAEYMTAPIRNLVPLDAETHIELGALVEPMAVGFRGILQGGCQPGKPAVVIGGGTIGIACLLAAQRRGAHPVVVSELVDHRRDAAAALGALVVDPSREDLTLRVRALSDGMGATCVVDAVGTSRTTRAAIEACAPGGIVVLVGMESQVVEIPLYEVVTQERHIVGNRGYTAENFRDTASWVSTEPIALADYIEERVTLEGAIDAFHDLGTGRRDARKVVVIPH